jgi:FkbH-like protein
MEEIRQLLDRFRKQPTLLSAVETSNRLRDIPHGELPAVRIAILRDFTMEQIQPYLEVRCAEAGLWPSLFFGQVDTAQRDVRDHESEFYRFQPDIVVLALRLDGIVPDLKERFNGLSQAAIGDLIGTAHSRVRDTVQAVRERSQCVILVHSFELPVFPARGILDSSPAGQTQCIRRLNFQLTDTLSAFDQTFVVDVDHILGRIGYESALDSRSWHVARAPYSPVCLDRLACYYTRFATALKGKNRKCLVLDCDNTLWGGVVGEEGLSGIQLGTMHPGSAFRAMQLTVLDFFHRGVLLALNTKNNQQDVLEVLREHPDCILKPEHFACLKINWQDKAANLREIASELNIGLDSLVFVDDNESECEFVRNALPEVEVLCLSRDPTRHERDLRSLGCFDTLALTEEDLARTQFYQTERARRATLGQSQTYEEYLRSLEMILTIERGGGLNAPRVAQLSQKTNQFNLTTRRYSESDIRQMLSDPNTTVYSVRLVDRFGDSGIIGVAIVKRNEHEALIDSLLVSCRVIGRGVEQAMLAVIAADEKSRGSGILVGQYLPTTKNHVTADFYPKNGFKENQAGTFKMPLQSGTLGVPPWFKAVKLG